MFCPSKSQFHLCGLPFSSSSYSHLLVKLIADCSFLGEDRNMRCQQLLIYFQKTIAAKRRRLFSLPAREGLWLFLIFAIAASEHDSAYAERNRSLTRRLSSSVHWRRTLMEHIGPSSQASVLETPTYSSEEIAILLATRRSFGDH